MKKGIKNLLIPVATTAGIKLICDYSPKLIKQLTKNQTFTLKIKSFNPSYQIINKWILNLNKPVFNNNIEPTRFFISGIEEKYFSICNGEFSCMLDNLTILLVNKQHFDDFDELTISIIGKNMNKYKQQLITLLNSYNKNDTLTISHTDCIRHITKKTFDMISNDQIPLIKKHLDDWKNSKDEYHNHGLIHKTGIMLYGPPGTGKTSIAKAIASYLDYDLIVMTKNDLKAGQFYSDKLYKPQVVLFEDIDCIFKDRNNNSENTNELFNTMLNLLDGTLSAEGCVFVATTNNIEHLDEALVRPGRFDINIKIDNLNNQEAVRLCNIFNVDPTSVLKNISFPINPAYLQNKILKFKKEILKYE